MVDVPLVRPATVPEAVMVATLVLLLCHVPPIALVSMVVSPWQTDNVPPVAAGNALTVMVVVLVQPEAVVIVIVVVPAVMPVTTPEVAFTVPTAVLLLLQVPDVSVFANVISD